MLNVVNIYPYSTIYRFNNIKIRHLYHITYNRQNHYYFVIMLLFDKKPHFYQKSTNKFVYFYLNNNRQIAKIHLTC